MTARKDTDVCFYEAFDEEADVLRRHLPSNLRAAFTCKTIQEAGDVKPPAKLVSIRTQSVIPVSWAGEVSGVLARATGYDGLKRWLAEIKVNLPCGHLPLYCARAVAEQAMLLWMALFRKLPQQMEQFERFERDGLTGFECEHKKLLCVGVGNIGIEVVKIGAGLGMDARGVDIVRRHPSVTYVSPEEGIPWADVIVCAMNLTSANARYFRYERLRTAKRGVVFVNVARGELSPSADLLRLLDEGHLGGVALDVFEDEAQLAVSMRERRAIRDDKLRATLELAKRPNVIFTPHNAFNTHESVERKAKQSVQQVEHFLKHGKFVWPVPG